MANIVFPNAQQHTYKAIKTARKTGLRFNEEDFGIFNAGDNYYLFNKARYMAYPIEKDLYEQLYMASLATIKKEKFNNHTMSELLANNVFLLTG